MNRNERKGMAKERKEERVYEVNISEENCRSSESVSERRDHDAKGQTNIRTNK